mmetsp:Transcript_60554/g.124646  ORF Transcript_60554/g.124646 Transcript_60554/m.124646 type:complete len:85 (+) Transcript_60554:897-1151(+)
MRAEHPDLNLTLTFLQLWHSQLRRETRFSPMLSRERMQFSKPTTKQDATRDNVSPADKLVTLHAHAEMVFQENKCNRESADGTE